MSNICVFLGLVSGVVKNFGGSLDIRVIIWVIICFCYIRVERFRVKYF